LSVLCVPSRLGKLEGSPLPDAHITLITSSLYKTRSIGMTKTGYLFAFHIILLYRLYSRFIRWRPNGVNECGGRCGFGRGEVTPSAAGHILLARALLFVRFALSSIHVFHLSHFTAVPTLFVLRQTCG
jgi:hypothetical protein